MTASDHLGGQFNLAPHMEQPEGEDIRAHMLQHHGLVEHSVLGLSSPEMLASVHHESHRAPEYESHQHAFPTKSPELSHYGVYTAPRGSSPAGRAN